MTNPPPSTRFLPLFRASDDLEAVCDGLARRLGFKPVERAAA